MELGPKALFQWHEPREYARARNEKARQSRSKGFIPALAAILSTMLTLNGLAQAISKDLPVRPPWRWLAIWTTGVVIFYFLLWGLSFWPEARRVTISKR